LLNNKRENAVVEFLDYQISERYPNANAKFPDFSGISIDIWEKK